MATFTPADQPAPKPGQQPQAQPRGAPRFTPATEYTPPKGRGQTPDRPIDLSGLSHADEQSAIAKLPRGKNGAYYVGDDGLLHQNVNGPGGNPTLNVPRGTTLGADGNLYHPDPRDPKRSPRLDFHPTSGWYVQGADGHNYDVEGHYKPGIGKDYNPVAGVAASFDRGTGVGDEAAGGLAAGLGLLTGQDKFDPKHPLKSVGGAFTDHMRQQRELEDTYQNRHPALAGLARGGGMAATMLVPGPKGLPAMTRVGNAAQGAVTGATAGSLYALADRGSVQQRIAAAGSPKGAAINAVIGGGLGGLIPGAAAPKAKAPRPVSAQTPASLLSQEGVNLTPGQRIGGLAKGFEDLAQRSPILGGAIRGARGRGVESLNVAVANRALGPIGETLPAHVKPGHQAVEHVADRLGKVYDDAAAMVPVVNVKDPVLAERMQAIAQRVGELPPDISPQLQAIIRNRVQPTLSKSTVSGSDIRAVQNDLARESRARSGSADASQRALGDVLDDIHGELGGLIGRASPEAEAMIQRAGEGWKNFAVLRNAASKASKDGVFSPGQLATSVRMMDRSVGKGNVAKGRATMQDLSSSASQVMPDAFGNPGTADALGYGALATAAVAPGHVGIPAAAGLTVAATPYALMGRAIHRNSANATGAGAMRAAQALKALAARDPKLLPLYQDALQRATRSLAAAGQSDQPTPLAATR